MDGEMDGGKTERNEGGGGRGQERGVCGREGKMKGPKQPSRRGRGVIFTSRRYNLTDTNMSS